MRRGDLEAFLSRDRAKVERAKDLHWRRRIRRLGPMEALRTADELHRSTQLLQPGWPTTRDREEDLQAHQALSETLRRASVGRR